MFSVDSKAERLHTYTERVRKRERDGVGLRELVGEIIQSIIAEQRVASPLLP